jgi:hypothetical protein
MLSSKYKPNCNPAVDHRLICTNQRETGEDKRRERDRYFLFLKGRYEYAECENDEGVGSILGLGGCSL